MVYSVGMNTIAFESAGVATCAGCQAIVPKGLMCVTTGINDYCPLCVQNRIDSGDEVFEKAVDEFCRAEFEKIRGASH